MLDEYYPFTICPDKYKVNRKVKLIVFFAIGRMKK